jgi:GNAT superfamily N-acetyltransferase
VSQPASLTIRFFAVTDPDDAERVHRAHARSITPHLADRDPSFFERAAENGELYAVDVGDEIAAVCYVVEHGERWELGGIFVEPRWRGAHIASRLCRLAIANAVVNDQDIAANLMAHVHENNAKPRPLLKALGFVRDGEAVYADDEAPKSLERNADNNVVGHLFRFDKTYLAEIAADLRQAAGTMTTSHGVYDVEVDMRLAADPEVYLELLEEIATEE